MIQLQKGDILKADAEALVNTVNCVGVMGRGIALQFKKAYPDNFKKYKAACDDKKVRPGHMIIFETGNMFNPRYIINFPTKRHWRGKSRIEDIESGLKTLADEVRKRNIRSIAIPPLGCGLGGLDWNIVRSMIEKTFEEFPDVQVILFEPAGAPSAKSMAINRRKPNMTKGRAALLSLMNRYLQAAMDPFVTLLEIHKLMYFAQEAGEPLRLSYKKGLYGPYAENLRHVLNVIEGHFITGYADASDNPDKQIKLKPNIIKAANDVLKAHPETTSHLERVADLITGFETPYGMELLSTVHWVATRDKAATSDRVVRETYAWNSRKRMFQEKHIRVAFNTLVKKGWIRGAET
ncbi:MAG: Appr-1-p processing protein [Deltaproteobacteria bacterium]|nr:MAG: Appr-1-p processing protein [Deltaproteobacteria bacterium]